MKKNLVFYSVTILFIFNGCSTQTLSKAGYELIQQRSEIECQKAVGADRAACFSRINRKTYTEYEKERSTSPINR
jgi:hypothetical protein